MHCDCCDKLLTEAEATARFVESGAFVEMCAECRSFLPPDLQWRTRRDLERKAREAEDSDTDYNSNPFNAEDYYGGDDE